MEKVFNKNFIRCKIRRTEMITIRLEYPKEPVLEKGVFKVFFG